MLQHEDMTIPKHFFAEPLLPEKHEDKERILMAVMFKDQTNRTHLQFTYAYEAKDSNDKHLDDFIMPII
jgi:hypothetical protein